jgi:hypothetical protein
MKKTTTLTPPDLKRCQAEKPNGNTFMTLGGRPGRVRCDQLPIYIATENKAGADGQRGSMALCNDCSAVLIEQLGKDYATLTPITDVDRFIDDNLESTPAGFIRTSPENFRAFVERITKTPKGMVLVDVDDVKVVIAYCKALSGERRKLMARFILAHRRLCKAVGLPEL